MKIKDTVLLPVEKIHPNPWNCNEQKEQTFNSLQQDISEGFDQPIRVSPCSCTKQADPHYMIIDGEHRFRACVAEEAKKVPCVIYDGLTEEQIKIMSVRKNLQTGEINNQKFMEMVDSLSSYEGDLVEEMAFTSEKEFQKHIIQDTGSGTAPTPPPESEATDGENTLGGLDDVVNSIFTDFGDSVPQGFLFFSYKGKTHLLVNCSDELQARLQEITEELKDSGENVNDYMQRKLCQNPS